MYQAVTELELKQEELIASLNLTTEQLLILNEILEIERDLTLEETN